MWLSSTEFQQLIEPLSDLVAEMNKNPELVEDAVLPGFFLHKLKLVKQILELSHNINKVAPESQIEIVIFKHEMVSLDGLITFGFVDGVLASKISNEAKIASLRWNLFKPTEVYLREAEYESIWTAGEHLYDLMQEHSIEPELAFLQLYSRKARLMVALYRFLTEQGTDQGFKLSCK